jgi:hypothetical protein
MAEREALPLFADQIAEEQPGEDEVMASREIAWHLSEQRTRKWKADRWRKARQELRAFSDNERRVLTDAWNMAPYPGDPTYLLDFLHRYRIGRFTLDAVPFNFNREQSA